MPRISHALLLGLTAGLFLAPPAARAAGAQEPVRYLKAARLLDVRTGTIERDIVVGVSGTRITLVAQAADARLPADAAPLDLGDVTLLPGLIDTHVHLTIGGDPAANARATLLAGFTTVRDLGSLDYAALELRRRIAAGEVVGPDIVASGPWLGASGATCDFNGIGVRGPDAFAARVRADRAHGVDVIKVCLTGWPQEAYAYPDSVELTRAELDAVVAEARRDGLGVVAHALSRASVREVLRAGVTELVHAAYMDTSDIALLRERRVVLVPTLWSLVKRAPGAPGDSLFASFQRTVRAGVPIIFGTDAGVIAHGQNATEFQWLVRAGMSPAAAIRAATLDAAAWLELAHDRGTIKAGKRADLIAVPGDPLQDITVLERPVFVMRNGVIYREPQAAATETAGLPRH